MLERLKQLVTEEKGQGMAEYGLIMALIAVVGVVALGPLGEKIRDIFQDITDNGFEYSESEG
jgi:pilus assembly protein Flp/PilA